MEFKVFLGGALIVSSSLFAQDSIAKNTKQSDLIQRFEQISGKEPNYADTIRVLRGKLAESESTIDEQQRTIKQLEVEVIQLEKYFLVGKYGQVGRWTAYGKTQVEEFKANSFLTNYNLSYPGIHIYFAFEERSIPMELYQQEIVRLVDEWKKNPNRKIRIEGYTDTWGSAETNKNYSQERALFVKAYLLSLKVPDSAIEMRNEGVAGANRYKEPEMDFLNRQVILSLV